MTVLEEKITIHAGGNEPTKQTGETGAKVIRARQTPCANRLT
jgi:hypothetical protein